MKPNIDPKVDFAFKWLFGNIANDDLLIDLLNAVLDPPPEHRVESLEIMNPFNDKDAMDDRLSILDIKAREVSGRYFNVEMQMAATRVFPNRVLYYWCILHSVQLDSGGKFESLKPTVSISIVNDILFPTTPDYHLEFGVRNTKHADLVFSPHLAVHVIELPKFKLAVQELKTPLERWCYFLIHGQEFDTQALPATMLVKPVRKAMKVMEMLSQTKLEWLKYQDRLKGIRDQHSREVEAAEDREKAIAEAVAQAVAQAVTQAVAQTEAIGIEKERKLLIRQIHVLQRTLGIEKTSLEVLQNTPISELNAMANDLDSRVQNG